MSISLTVRGLRSLLHKIARILALPLRGNKGGQTLGEDLSSTGGFVTEKFSYRKPDVD